MDIIAPRDSLTGADLVSVSGNKASRVFEVESGATVSLDGLIIADGLGTSGGIKIGGGIFDSGGGIFNTGNLEVSNCIISNNSANVPQPGVSIGSGDGGGIFNSGILTVSNSIINNNLSGGIGTVGGGIYNGGMLTVSNSTISGNRGFIGGGIYNAGISTVSNSTISGNSVTSGGGGIFNSDNLEVSNSTISGNSVENEGGGIYNAGTSTVSNSTISANSAGSGGGIFSGENLEVVLEVSNSTISGNSAGSGGGIFNLVSTTTVSNSTISGNSASAGGGIYDQSGSINQSSSLTLVFSTLTGNQAANGGGVFNAPSEVFGSIVIPPSSASVRNTIIAANLALANGVNPDVSGTFTSNGYNLIGDSTGSTGFGTTGDIVGTSLNPIDPRLAPLDFYGGSTQTIALLPDSPAIGAGDPTVLDTDPTTDQRGLPRRALDGSTDIGAFEFST